MKGRIKSGVLLSMVTASFFVSVAVVDAVAEQPTRSGTTQLSCVSRGNQEVQLDWTRKGDRLHTTVSRYKLHGKEPNNIGRVTLYVHDKVNASSGAEGLIVDGNWHSSNMKSSQVIPADARSVWVGAQLMSGGFPGYEGCRVERDLALE